MGDGACCLGAADIRVDVAKTAGMSSGCQISVSDLTAWSVNTNNYQREKHGRAFTLYRLTDQSRNIARFWDLGSWGRTCLGGGERWGRSTLGRGTMDKTGRGNVCL